MNKITKKNTNLATNMQLTCKNAKTMAPDAIIIKL